MDRPGQRAQGSAGRQGMPIAGGRAALRAPFRPPRRDPGASVPSILPLRARPFLLQNLRRNVCPHFYMTGPRGAIPVQAPHLLKGMIRQPQNTNRCQLRAGVHLEEGYVLDVCLSARFNQCVFYEDELTRVEERRR